MLLRDHPIMSYRGLRHWPPIWSWVEGLGDKHPKGEIGILKSVTFSNTLPANRCFLNIYYEGSDYLGCLLFDNHVFGSQIANLLQDCCNRPIAEIGSLDLTHTF